MITTFGAAATPALAVPDKRKAGNEHESYCS